MWGSVHLPELTAVSAMEPGADSFPVGLSSVDRSRTNSRGDATLERPQAPQGVCTTVAALHHGIQDTAAHTIGRLVRSIRQQDSINLLRFSLPNFTAWQRLQKSASRTETRARNPSRFYPLLSHCVSYLYP